MRPNSKLIKATLTGALGGLLYGFDTIVISGFIDTVTRLYHLSPRGIGLTVAASPIGNILGCFAAGVIGQRIGTRATLRGAAVLYTLAALAAAFSVGWPMLLVARFVGGFAIGAASVAGPVYIAELAPAQWRGRLVGAFQINVVSGILIGLISNYLVRLASLGALEWRVMVGVAAAPALIFLLLLFFIPRSPRWSVSRNEIDEALRVLGLVGAPDPKAELADIQAALQAEHATVHEPVFQWKYRYPLFLAIAIGAFNQLTGINAILSYVHTIFTAAGFNQLSSDSQAIAIGATNLIFTLVGMAMIDKFGRKTLLIVGAIGDAVCLSGVAWIFNSNSHQAALLPLLVLFIAFFALSQGLVVFVYIGEVFPNAVRAKGQGVGNASLSAINMAILFAFPILAHSFSQGTPFVFFAAATVVQLIVVGLFFPETKGQTLEQLQRKLMRG
ncbi:D-xylose transporter XylE [Candidatus Sulfotelmatomonas gaucii]|uniref:D-xylose transporter XylE n=1 Tax=Candidatus Sulfuritelmatomonas gaucii TaxID=2043161 RepID=A0A2N9LA72_9BACT|nr:D-xylose transporter XylE [Candidatus Sulfotelmatomonas gaucii]